MTPVAENLWLLSFPLKLLGVDIRRHVTVIRLRSGRLVIHSTAPFSPADVAEIRRLGEPGWIVEAMLRHDTFSEEGREAFPDIPFLAPPGFADHAKFPVQPILPIPGEWRGELEARELAGIPKMRETVFYHRPSRTLIVADLISHFPGDAPAWSELMLTAAMGSNHCPGMARTFKLSISDEAAFRVSVREMMQWDFDRVIVGHGQMIESDGKEKLAAVLREAGLD